ncbi:outer membrane lipoprotein carrier protein LolA [Azonexus sp.]|uniref:outer membrane lipoprotein carrier protein LolA n=1 Tax=Azonexus sp. TaxID=1872668 RepID=UPI002826CA10|nr:outer membrane lipoprotein carrier protein LolA [Azonexus sp.]MDR1994331.1 outer membrane lipoprotein carrier protein LolA [Azonexus sp.]
MKTMRYFIFLLLFLSGGAARAFDLAQLQAQLQAYPVVRGQFTQQKFLRSLETPLTSQGDFSLALNKGLLWRLRQPFAQELRISPKGIARRDEQGRWQDLPSQAGGGRENRLFLSLLSGDTQGILDNFEIALQGNSADWRMTLTPRSALLRQIFTDITIEGGATVKRIELRETQGDRTLVKMANTQTAQQLTDEEARAWNG